MAVTANPDSASGREEQDFFHNDALVKIRSQTNSGLENQKQAAIILTAVEEAIQEQGEQLTPLAYFGALMTILEQQRATAVDAEQRGVLVAVTHILSIVFPRIPSSILRLKFDDVSRTLGGTLEAYQDEQPLVRSVLACFESLLSAQDHARWTTDLTCKKLFQVLLVMSVDGRPKVRRRALEAVKRILCRPPPPSTHHPATLTTIDYTMGSLQEYAETVGSVSAKNRKELEQQVLHVLVFLKATLPVLAMQGGHDRTRGKLRALCETLLRLPVRSSGTGNTILTQWIFSVLEALFGTSLEKEEIFPHLDMALLDSVIRALLEMRPYQNDATLIPAWLELIGKGFSKLAELAREAERNEDGMMSTERQYALTDFPDLLVSVFKKTFEAVFGQQATKAVIVNKAAQVFSAMVRECVTETMVQEASRSDMTDDAESRLMVMIQVINTGLSDIRYRSAWGGILGIAEALFDRLGSVLPQLVRGTLFNVMAFRDDPAYGESFPYKEELEVALHAAVQSLGFENFVSFVPLNIENEIPSQPRRPYLLSTFMEALNRPLPTIIGIPSSAFGPHTLSFLSKDLLPLAQRMFEKSGDAWRGNRQVEAKLYETIGTQVWALVPGFCSTLPPDVESSFATTGPVFGKILQGAPKEVFLDLPSEPDFRPVVCEALQNLVEGYRKVADVKGMEDGRDDVVAQRKKDANQAAQGLENFKSYATRFLSVLCNNYTTLPPDILDATKGQALQSLHERENQHYARTIQSFLPIADPSAVNSYFLSLVTTLLQSQSQPHPEPESAVAQMGRLRDYAILDLLLILLPFVPASTTSGDSPVEVFYKVLTGQLRDADPTLQKRTYKALNHVIEYLRPPVLNLEELVNRLLDPEVLSKASSGAKKARMQLLQRVAIAIPAQDQALLLTYIPVALSEVMLATKEASEKARNAAYDCLVAMGRKMLTGGVTEDAWDMDALQRALDDETPGGQVNLKEYFTMVVAGLAGDTATMQSAAVSSLGRLVFEFGSRLDDAFLRELVSTVLIVMESKNREVVKAALGFVKVAVVTVPQDVLADELEHIVSSILAHTSPHKSAFKSKVRHIFERLVRKFSYEAVEGFVPDSDKKLLNNIRKRRERLKKRKAAARQAQEESESEEEQIEKPRKVAQKQFEEALYGSESELSSSDDDEKYIPDRFKDALQRTKTPQASKTRIREDEDVADFLDARIVSRVTSAPSSKSRSTPHEFATQDGKLVFEDPSDSDEAEPQEPEPEDHYKASRISELAFTRTPTGNIKFLQPNKRKRDDPDEEGATGTGLGWGQGKLKKKDDMDKAEMERMLGRQYRAKRAKGDVKKAGMPDPFAYIPLTSKVVGGQKRKGAKIAGRFKSMMKATRDGSEVVVKGGGSGGTNKGGKKGNKRHK
ncbi:mRNA-binding protein RRP12 [Spizellomyces punctatus DAOM BR117]|uniref:Uncharacterized protein n=1 Tax=Spizellomyces punctatus (strain DAOM BR117) TaxID=645134 RepID=A0A0L0HCD6_SPIPD|nr:mRNA-binding protein RRP12 [Spizellomyces punctatus DAOM BR117]KNC98554.1 hypothetical protein SPPG_06243 [Spizellomyces punctatus DAOM BR117]|eukprot:XP_016606594.1 hypothetical protein SPPG_06243 [Spizellomyces punctatus DAOM BR117]